MIGVLREMKKEYYNATGMPDKWRIIRKAYKILLPKIMELSEIDKSFGLDPYLIGFDLSPIEYGVWMIIRHEGLPFYPQFPVLNYFIDFANPYLKIGVEVDGKAWHNSKKDRERDERLAEIGWKIFRISGSEVWGNQDEDASVKVMRAIKNIYFKDDRSGEDLAILDNHKLAEFEL